MNQTFRIAPAYEMNGHWVVGDKSEVTEDLFWEKLKSKVESLTKDIPEQYDETFERAKTHLLAIDKTNSTIIDTWFEVTITKNKKNTS